MRATIRPNTAAEERSIQRGIAQDTDNPERGEEFFASAVPAAEHAELGGIVRRYRGPAKRETKALVTLRLDRDVLAGLRASGRGWQGRVNEALRKLVE